MMDVDGRTHGGTRTPEVILARHLSLPGPPLTEDDRRLLIEAGLVEEGELVREASPIVGVSDLYWAYDGERWSVIYRDGRPLLVPRSEAWQEPLSPMQRVEREFAVAVLVSELICGFAGTDEDVARVRSESPWSTSFAEAERRDAASHSQIQTGGSDTDE